MRVQGDQGERLVAQILAILEVRDVEGRGEGEEGLRKVSTSAPFLEHELVDNVSDIARRLGGEWYT